MSKKKPRRQWVTKKHSSQDVWFEEDDELRQYFAFNQKLYPESTIEETIQDLVDLGHISVRINDAGNREYKVNIEHLRKAIEQLPDSIRNDPRDIQIHESTARICDYDHDMAMLLSVIIQQNNDLSDQEKGAPWFVKTQDQLTYDTMELVKDFQKSLAQLEAKNFIEVTENGPTQYRYRLNVAAVQAAIDILPEEDE